MRANDPAVLSALAYIEQKHGAPDRARRLYEKALALDPSLLDASTNLGVIKAEGGDLAGAITLWQDAFERAPGRSSIGMNLARAFASWAASTRRVATRYACWSLIPTCQPGSGC